MSANGTSPSSPIHNAPTFATIEKFPDLLPASEYVSKDKVYSLVHQGKVPVYRLPGVKPACVRVDEARAVLAALSAQGKIRRGYGSFGPDAVVRDLSNVSGQDFEVLK